ncbi:glutamate--tRNA ligase [Myxococcota bacterium]|nr:glutamate--tRNA ligase [Myxococcota bacterium]MBU1430694.1 glutamate--tRNA ligase [Myxococcota bacterium]MBU1900228.1 glutamate--tRNA ligase [Myxococcota bacterium]
MTVRTRIAPSPTGDPHVGTAYIALFNYCFAKQQGGEFILRIEDTDQARSTRESEAQILASLRWLGLDWDEGPDVGGPHGPYRQSERAEIYQAHVQQLLDAGHAFRCFCGGERLAELRARQIAEKSGKLGYDGHCLGLSEAEVQAKLAEGAAHVVRMRVPTEGKCVIQDRLRGEILIDWDQVDMQVLLKSDGLPTYHLANVVDDHLMGITHVMRGEEWISSAPKHLLLYQYFGWAPPQLAHLPLLRNPDGSKLSKRKNPTSILYYQRMGFLAEGLLNYLGRMGWSMPDESEKFTLAQMIEHFKIDDISLGGPIFDQVKLGWLNGLWIREALSDEEIAARVVSWALNAAYAAPIIPLVRQRIQKLSDLGPMVTHFFSGLFDPKPEDFAHKKLEPQQVQQALIFVQWRLDGLPGWEREAIEAALKAVAQMMDLKLRDLLQPIFIAISGQAVSTPLYDTMVILGRDLCRARLRQASDCLGVVGKKVEKRWRKAYEDAEASLTTTP